MAFLLKPTYEKVLLAMRDGLPRNHDDICIAAGLDDMECTGCISILRRNKALESAGKWQYKITDKGRDLLEHAPRITVGIRNG